MKQQSTFALLGALLLCGSLSLVSAQSNPPIDSLVRIGKKLSLDYPDSSLVYSYDAYRQSVAIDYYWGQLNSAQWISEAYGMKGALDSAAVYDNIALDLSIVAQDSAEIANNLVAIGQKQAYQGENKESIEKYHQARSIMIARRDTNDLTDLHLRMGNSFDNLDMLDSAMYNYNLAIEYGTAIGDTLYVGYALQNISTCHKKLGNVDKAFEVVGEALKMFIEVDDKYSIMGAYNNRGVMYKEIKDYDKALADYVQVMNLAEEIDYDRGKMAASINGGILSNLIGDYQKGQKQLTSGAELANKLGFKLSESDARNNLAESYFQQGNFNKAERELSKALQLSAETGSLEKQFDGHEIGKKLYSKKGDLSQALFHAGQVQVYSDSIFQLEKAKQIDEIQTKYGTEKKEAQITLLNKNAELDATKKRSLWIGLILLALTAISVINSLIQKRKREHLRLTKERELETERRKHSERELEYKQKELTAKMVQLAGKNEFLQSLESEVGLLKSSIDAGVSKSSQKISRLIKQDAIGDEEWNHFTQEFSVLHKDFIDRLSDQFGNFSKNELRLVSLMKMNLSTKEIANTLRVSPDGVKKARYRLRKKMGLDSSIDLQDYLLSY